jgi:hypothetical protein
VHNFNISRSGLLAAASAKHIRSSFFFLLYHTSCRKVSRIPFFPAASPTVPLAKFAGKAFLTCNILYPTTILCTVKPKGGNHLCATIADSVATIVFGSSSLFLSCAAAAAVADSAVAAAAAVTTAADANTKKAAAIAAAYSIHNSGFADLFLSADITI